MSAMMLWTAMLAAAAPAPSVAPAYRPPLLSVHHVAISVKDCDALARWYVEKLGFTITKRFQSGLNQIAWIDIPGFRLGLMQVPGSSRAPQQQAIPPADTRFQGYKHILFTVPDVDDAYRRMVAAGIAFLSPPTSFSPPGIRIAYLHDPEGNVIGLYQDTDAANALRR